MVLLSPQKKTRKPISFRCKDVCLRGIEIGANACSDDGGTLSPRLGRGRLQPGYLALAIHPPGIENHKTVFMK
jgi:hypothetical protein